MANVALCGLRIHSSDENGLLQLTANATCEKVCDT